MRPGTRIFVLVCPAALRSQPRGARQTGAPAAPTARGGVEKILGNQPRGSSGISRGGASLAGSTR